MSSEAYEIVIDSKHVSVDDNRYSAIPTDKGWKIEGPSVEVEDRKEALEYLKEDGFEPDMYPSQGIEGPFSLIHDSGDAVIWYNEERVAAVLEKEQMSREDLEGFANILQGNVDEFRTDEFLEGEYDEDQYGEDSKELEA